MLITLKTIPTPNSFTAPSVLEYHIEFHFVSPSDSENKDVYAVTVDKCEQNSLSEMCFEQPSGHKLSSEVVRDFSQALLAIFFFPIQPQI
jgi:hypothetical protein